MGITFTGGGELGDAELADLRDALPGETGRLLEQQRGGQVDLVHRGPVGRQVEDPDLFAVRGSASLADGSQHCGGRVRLLLECLDRCHGPIASGRTDSSRRCFPAGSRM